MLTATRRSQFRRLWRAGHAAVLYASPSKHCLRTILRRRFRETSAAAAASEEQVENTLRFLHAAASTRGVEHAIVRNLCHVHWQRAFTKKRPIKQDATFLDVVDARRTAYKDMDLTLLMLNRTLQLSLAY